jgi:LysM repeat protein
VAAASAPAPTTSPTRRAPSVAPSAGPSSSAQPSAPATYKVKKGDTLSGIAKRFGTTTATLRTLNALKTTTLKVGQVLKLH